MALNQYEKAKVASFICVAALLLCGFKSLFEPQKVVDLSQDHPLAGKVKLGKIDGVPGTENMLPPSWYKFLFPSGVSDRDANKSTVSGIFAEALKKNGYLASRAEDAIYQIDISYYAFRLEPLANGSAHLSEGDVYLRNIDTGKVVWRGFAAFGGDTVGSFSWSAIVQDVNRHLFRTLGTTLVGPAPWETQADVIAEILKHNEDNPRQVYTVNARSAEKHIRHGMKFGVRYASEDLMRQLSRFDPTVPYKKDSRNKAFEDMLNKWMETD